MKRLCMALWLACSACSLGPDAPPAPTVEAEVIARMQGEWRIALTAEQRKQVHTMRFLLQVPPPSNDDLKALQLTDAESRAAILILNEIRYDPDGERTAQLRSAIAGLESGELSIGPDRLEVRLGGVKKSGTYAIVATTGDAVHLRLTTPDGKEESVAMSLTPDQELLFGEGADSVRFVKR